MKQRRKMLFTLLLIVISLSLVLAGCGSNDATNNTTNTTGNEQPAAGDNQPADAVQEQVTLKMYSFWEAEAGPSLTEINKRFMEKYPHIKIEYENAAIDQYQSTIKIRLASGDAPDIFGVWPGTFLNPFVSAGYLMDLSDRPWVPRLQQGAKDMESVDGKVYGLPLNQNAIGVIYNKQIFRDLELDIPQNWNEFLEVSEQIKAAGITPIVLGNKDLWVTQLIPYAMAPNAIYKDNIKFDAQMYAGEATFLNSPWQQMMEDYVALDQKGYFNKGNLGTNYDQMIQMMATGKAAMEVMGNWGLPPILAANPEAELGMFPLPYVEEGENIWVSSAIALGLAGYAKTEHPEEVKLYIDFWAEPENNEFLLAQTKSFPVFNDVNPELDPVLKELIPALNVGTYNFLDQNWPQGVQDTLFTNIQNVLIDGGQNYPIEEMLKELDKVFVKSAKAAAESN